MCTNDNFIVFHLPSTGANRAFGTTAIAAEGAGRITTVIGAVVDVQVS